MYNNDEYPKEKISEILNEKFNLNSIEDGEDKFDGAASLLKPSDQDKGSKFGQKNRPMRMKNRPKRPNTRPKKQFRPTLQFRPNLQFRPKPQFRPKLRPNQLKRRRPKPLRQVNKLI